MVATDPACWGRRPQDLRLHIPQPGFLSWFMRCTAETIARRVNGEEDTSGRFWSGRFCSMQILDQTLLMRHSTVKMASVTDGTSNTILLGETIHYNFWPSGWDPKVYGCARSSDMRFAAVLALARVAAQRINPPRTRPMSCAARPLSEPSATMVAAAARAATIGRVESRSLGPCLLEERAMQKDRYSIEAWIMGILLVASTALAAEPDGEWPGWRGPNRDGKSTETGLLAQWPEAGPSCCGKWTGSATATRVWPSVEARSTSREWSTAT